MLQFQIMAVPEKIVSDVSIWNRLKENLWWCAESVENTDFSVRQVTSQCWMPLLNIPFVLWFYLLFSYDCVTWKLYMLFLHDSVILCENELTFYACMCHLNCRSFWCFLILLILKRETCLWCQVEKPKYCACMLSSKMTF